MYIYMYGWVENLDGYIQKQKTKELLYSFLIQVVIISLNK